MPVKNETVQRIIEAAKKLFLRYGYSRVVVDDITRELGISKKTIYNHFNSKADILTACIEQFAQDYQRQADTILNDVDLPLRQKLNAYLRFIGVSFTDIDKSFLQDLKRSEPECWQRINDLRRDIVLKHFTQLIDEGVRVGYLRDDSSRHLAILVYIGSMQQLTDLDYLSLFPENMTKAVPDDAQALADQTIQLLLSGMLTPKFYNEANPPTET